MVDARKFGRGRTRRRSSADARALPLFFFRPEKPVGRHRIQSRDERRSVGREEGLEEDQAAVDRGPQGERKRQERLEVRAQEVRGKIREGDGLVRRARDPST